jgi:hypothetical protein
MKFNLLHALLASFLFLSGNLYAQSNQSFLFSGSQDQLNIDLKADIFRTEYKYEEVQSTCYREYTEHKQVCANVPRQKCVPGREICSVVNEQRCRQSPPVCRPVCHNGPQGQICRNVCSNGAPICESIPVNRCSPSAPICSSYLSYECNVQPIYHRDPYACTETVKIPFQVFDHVTVVKANFKFARLIKGPELNELFNLELKNDEINLSVKSSKNVLISALKTSKLSNIGNQKLIEAEYVISFLDLKNLKEALTEISYIDLSNNQLSYSIGTATDILFKHYITLEQDKLFGRKTFIDGLVANNLIDSLNENGKQRYSIDLAKLDIIVKEKKHKVKIKIQPNLDSFTNVLNKEDIMNMSLSKEDTIKL